MKIGEKIVLKNLGEVIVLTEKSDTALVSKDGVAYFVTNPNKKRQEEEYSYDSASMFGFKVNEVYQLIQPMYEDIIATINKQYKIDDKLSKMLIESMVDKM
jgi:hypothetical protein